MRYLIKSIFNKSPAANINTQQYTETFLFVIIGLTFLIKIISLGFNSLLVEEAYYWNYAQHLDFGYLDHPPMVAVLIKLSTYLLGMSEFAVRAPTVLCWLVAAYFNVKLTSLIEPRTGIYAFFFLSVLPFFFLHSLILTPDAPLIACWSASLYFLYRALLLNEPKRWYLAGFWLGLGMLSKYTIVLVGGATIVYILLTPSLRYWLFKKEPYFCVAITSILFLPVIYWNATHDWISFAFQSSRRFNQPFHFSLPNLLGLLAFFLMPAGLYGLWDLSKNSIHRAQSSMDTNTKRFMLVFTAVPLMFFIWFSLFHRIKFNWIGPALLALVPWLAISLKRSPVQKMSRIFNLRNSWKITSYTLLVCYGLMVLSLISGKPEVVHQRIFKKLLDWQDFTLKVNSIAQNVESKSHNSPIIIPIDVYNINSELTFYQRKLFNEGRIKNIYKMVGQHIFGDNSLMYKYWPHENPKNRQIILISETYQFIENQQNNPKLTNVMPVMSFYSQSLGAGVKLKPFYYRMARML